MNWVKTMKVCLLFFMKIIYYVLLRLTYLIDFVFVLKLNSVKRNVF